jgi:hypothetical protein
LNTSPAGSRSKLFTRGGNLKHFTVQSLWLLAHACIYFTSMLLAGGGNRYGRQIRTVAHISPAMVLYLGAGAASRDIEFADQTSREHRRALHPHFYIDAE